MSVKFTWIIRNKLALQLICNAYEEDDEDNNVSYFGANFCTSNRIMFNSMGGKG